MAKLFNRAKMTTSTTGSGTVTLGGASVGYQSFADAGVSNGDVVQYVIEEGGNFEIGTGTYSATGTSLTRSPTESSNSDAAISLNGAATVSITAVADDLNRLQNAGSDIVTVSGSGASVTGNITVTGTVDGRDVAADGTKLDGIEAGADVTDTANVTAAGALMDSEVTNLAQVKAFDSSDYATAAQGTTADAALARSGGTMTGAITFASGQQFDGRDVSADGSKLDGIETGATADQTITAGSGLSGGGTGNVTLSHSDTSTQGSVNNSGRTYIQDITLDGFGHVTGIASATETVTAPTVNNATITISAGTDLTTGGNFTTNQGTNETITINHADTSTLSGTYGSTSNGTKIDQITVDARGHVTAITTGETGDIQGVTAGSGLTGGGSSGTVTLNHADTSSQGSVNNSGRTYIQDITLDTYGHITGITSATETVTNTDTIPNNATITLSAGTNLSGGGNFTTDQSSNETITFNVSSTPSFSSATFGSGVTLQESTDRPDLLQITSTTSTWGGLQIRNSSNEGRWSFMTDGSTAGLYDDENGDWHLQMSENGGVTLYANGTANFTTGTTYMEMARHLDMNNYDIYGVDQIFHHGDTNTYMQFHADDQWRVVTGGAERLEVNNSQITSTEPIHAPSFHGDGSSLTGISSSANSDIFWENGQTVTSNYTITNGKNAMSAGPITINSGVTVTIGDGETWTVV